MRKLLLLLVFLFGVLAAEPVYITEPFYAKLTDANDLYIGTVNPSMTFRVAIDQVPSPNGHWTRFQVLDNPSYVSLSVDEVYSFFMLKIAVSESAPDGGGDIVVKLIDDSHNLDDRVFNINFKVSRRPSEIKIEFPDLSIVAGKVAFASVKIDNRSPVTQNYMVQVKGLGSEWYGINRPVMSVKPLSSESRTIEIQPPVGVSGKATFSVVVYWVEGDEEISQDFTVVLEPKGVENQLNLLSEVYPASFLLRPISMLLALLAHLL